MKVWADLAMPYGECNWEKGASKTVSPAPMRIQALRILSGRVHQNFFHHVRVKNGIRKLCGQTAYATELYRCALNMVLSVRSQPGCPLRFGRPALLSCEDNLAGTRVPNAQHYVVFP